MDDPVDKVGAVWVGSVWVGLSESRMSSAWIGSLGSLELVSAMSETAEMCSGCVRWTRGKLLGVFKRACGTVQRRWSQ